MPLKITRTILRDLPLPPPLPEDTAELHALAQYVRSGKCILFVGAGLSAGAGLPTWPQLMERLVKKITCWAIDTGVVPDRISIADDDEDAWKGSVVRAVSKQLGEKNFNRLVSLINKNTKAHSTPQSIGIALEMIGRSSIDRAELMRLLQQKRFPELAEYCRNTLGTHEFNEQVRSALVSKKGILPIYKHIVRTPFSSVVTTNFDFLLEQAYEHFGNIGTPRAPTGVELTQLGTLLIDGSFFVLKAHGDALRPETMVFSSNDYRRLIHATPAFQAIFNSMLMTHALLFVGYSLSDTNFRLLLDQQFTLFNGQVPPRYALLSGVGDVETDILWQTARLQVLTYPDGQHQHVELFLKKLADVSGDKKIQKKKTAQPVAKNVLQKTEPTTSLRIDMQGGNFLIELTRPNTRSKTKAWAVPFCESDMQKLTKHTKEVILAHMERHSAMSEISSLGEEFIKILPPDFLEALHAITPESSLRIICNHKTHRIPWEWLPAKNQPLCLRHSISRTPVSLSDTARGYRTFNKPPRALIIGDAGSGQPPELPPLYGAEREAAEIVKKLRQHFSPRRVTHLSRQTATRDRILKELREGDYDIIHFGGHAWITDRESYFFTWDHVMLGSELTPLLSRRPPSLFVMSTHFTSFVPLGFTESFQDFQAKLEKRYTVIPDLESQNASAFAEVAMRCGVATFVGSFGEPPDEDSADSMIGFYQALLSGASVAKSLLTARKKRVQKGFTSSLMLTATGYGDLRFPLK